MVGLYREANCLSASQPPQEVKARKITLRVPLASFGRPPLASYLLYSIGKVLTPKQKGGVNVMRERGRRDRRSRKVYKGESKNNVSKMQCRYPRSVTKLQDLCPSISQLNLWSKSFHRD